MTTFRSKDAKTREANATAYAINDVISEAASGGTIWTFPAMGRNLQGAFGYITTAKLIQSTAEATALSAELFLFHTAPTSTQNDNLADALTAAEMLNCVGSILFDSGSVTTSRTIYTKTPNIEFKCEADDQSLYGVLLAKNAYTPITGGADTIDIVLSGIILE